MTPTKIYKVVPRKGKYCMPEKNGDYFTDLGIFRYQNGRWTDDHLHERSPTYHLEEVKEPVHIFTEEELKALIKEFSKITPHYFAKGHSMESAFDEYLKHKSL